MNAFLEDTKRAGAGWSHRPRDRWDIEHAWPAIATEPIAASTPPKSNAIDVTNAYDAVGSLYGEGRCFSSTQLSVLDFAGERGAYSDEADEVFEFTGWGTVRTYDAPDRSVYVRGHASQTFKFAQTPFLEGFHGHAVVSEDDYTWSSNTTSLYRITGVVTAMPPTRRARHHEPSRAYKVFKELGSWLEMSDEELASIVKISRTTVSASWKHGTEPRNREKARRLFQLHGLVSALHGNLGDRLPVWLKRGAPCPLRLLERGEIDQFERAADAIIFPPSPVPGGRLDAAWAPSTNRGMHDPGSDSRPRRATRVRSRQLKR